MSILVDAKTRLLVQGLTGREGSFHARQCREYGTQVVAGVTPGKGGQEVDGVPVFDTVRQAVAKTSANCSLLFVPPLAAADAILEAAEAGIPLVVAITEHIPVLDLFRVKRYLDHTGCRLLGPNSPGLISPGLAKVGIMPGGIHLPGSIGVISRSGTLTYEVVQQLTLVGLGQSTCIGIGGDPLVGTSFVDCLAAFESDPGTSGVVLVGEIGGNAEEEAARFVAERMTKPVVGFIAGLTAPPGRRMGHAGAIVSGAGSSAAAKIAALEQGGIRVCRDLGSLGRMCLKVFAG
jgi:succinyl-CoA synthetase alpha subunit